MKNGQNVHFLVSMMDMEEVAVQTFSEIVYINLLLKSLLSHGTQKKLLEMALPKQKKDIWTQIMTKKLKK